ncbi:unnamed protein product, partial [Mycena citricolor]
IASDSTHSQSARATQYLTIPARAKWLSNTMTTSSEHAALGIRAKQITLGRAARRNGFGSGVWREERCVPVPGTCSFLKPSESKCEIASRL